MLRLSVMTGFGLMSLFIQSTDGYASKKFVREKVAPVEQTAQTADAPSTTNEQNLGDLDTKVTEEVARLERESAEGRASTTQDAKRAQVAADRALM